MSTKELITKVIIDLDIPGISIPGIADLIGAFGEISPAEKCLIVIKNDINNYGFAYMHDGELRPGTRIEIRNDSSGVEYIRFLNLDFTPDQFYDIVGKSRYRYGAFSLSEIVEILTMGYFCKK